jgi:transcriptional regulator GlxA family with amidase domain
MIGVLIFPDFQLLDAAGPISVFEIAARLAGRPPSIKTIAVTPGAVRSSSGVEMLARGIRPATSIATLIVAGGWGVRAAVTCETTLKFVRAMAKRGVRVASVCSGAYILAEAGLLDGRRATTHWQRTQHFCKTYPKVKLEPDRIFVRDGISGARRASPPASISPLQWPRKISATTSRRKPRASSCSITAARAANRNSRRCWN